MSLVVIPFLIYIISWKICSYRAQESFSLLITIIIRWKIYSAKGCMKQTTSGSLEDIRHVPEITLPLPPQTPYLKIS